MNKKSIVILALFVIGLFAAAMTVSPAANHGACPRDGGCACMSADCGCLDGGTCTCGENCKCAEGCQCGKDCGCQEGKACTCGDDCKCGEGCKCGEECKCGHCGHHAK